MLALERILRDLIQDNFLHSSERIMKRRNISENSEFRTSQI